MSEFFLKIVNMSISATWIVLVVLVLRLLLKKAPKWVNVLLWGIVAVRLICPFSLESALSLIPSTETVSPGIMMDRTPRIDSGVPLVNGVVNPIISSSFTPDPMTSANPLQIFIPVVANFWILGMIVLLLHTAVSYWRVKRNVRTAVLLKENIFQSEHVASPFVLGIIKPKIYLPFAMGEESAYVIAHEKAHIRRKDHLWKPLGFLILTVHWLNPFVWLAYVLLCRDVELACDEKVVRDFDTTQKADYSQALLHCSINRRAIAACPLAFGEVGVKSRVKSVLNYKKPAFWMTSVAVLVCIAVALCFLTDPQKPEEKHIATETGKTQVYEQTPGEQVEKNIANEEFVYTLTHYKSRDIWVAGGYLYKYRLEITGRMHNAAKNTTYVVLSNTEDITFDMTWKAAGYSSNSQDYFDPQVAVIVGSRLFE